jgi:hypothetical protein
MVFILKIEIIFKSKKSEVSLIDLGISLCSTNPLAPTGK